MSGPDDRGDFEPRPGLWYRVRYGSGGPTLGERFRAAVLKPVDPDAPAKPEPKAQSLEELQATERYADDRERFLGLTAAPLAAAIGFLIANYLVDHDPSPYKNGHLNPLHANVTTYHTLEIVLLALAVAMLAMAWYRKRLFLGMAMALYGLGIFNLHYWGFGVPFLLGGAWYLVRAYRAHQAVRSATDAGRSPGGAGSGFSRPRANKRYTPPV
jgi:hypothetical protein